MAILRCSGVNTANRTDLATEIDYRAPENLMAMSLPTEDDENRSQRP